MKNNAQSYIDSIMLSSVYIHEQIDTILKTNIDLQDLVRKLREEIENKDKEIERLNDEILELEDTVEFYKDMSESDRYKDDC